MIDKEADAETPPGSVAHFGVRVYVSTVVGGSVNDYIVIQSRPQGTGFQT